MQDKTNRSGVSAAERTGEKKKQHHGLEDQNVTEPIRSEEPADKPPPSRPGLEDRNITQANPPRHIDDRR